MKGNGAGGLTMCNIRHQAMKHALVVIVRTVESHAKMGEVVQSLYQEAATLPSQLRTAR